MKEKTQKYRWKTKFRKKISEQTERSPQAGEDMNKTRISHAEISGFCLLCSHVSILDRGPSAGAVVDGALQLVGLHHVADIAAHGDAGQVDLGGDLLAGKALPRVGGQKLPDHGQGGQVQPLAQLGGRGRGLGQLSTDCRSTITTPEP